ncbi:MAG: RraA family protein [Clostridiales bacterium]
MNHMRQEELFELLRHTPTGNICDSMRRLGVSGYFKGLCCLQKELAANMVGPAITIAYIPKQAGYEVKGLGTFDLVRKTPAGSILLFASLGSLCWVTGGNVGQMMMTQGLGGMVVDGCIRDKKELAGQLMPVYCLGSGTKPYAEEIQCVAYNVPVDACGARVNPGDILVGDEDGICIIPPWALEDVCRQLPDIADIEEKLPLAIAAQESLDTINTIAARKGVPVKK